MSLDKQNVVYISNGIIFSHREKEILTHSTMWMNLKDILLSESRRKRKVYYFTYEVYKQIHTDRKHNTGYQDLGEGENEELLSDGYRGGCFCV